MNITPKYAHYIYRNATMLLRPKTQLKDMTVEVDPGTPSAGRVPSGYTIPQSQTAPDVNFEEFLAALDGETRDYLQELIDGAGVGLKGNSENLSADLQALRPDLALPRKITAAAEAAPQEHRTRDPQFPAVRQRARRQGHRNLTGDRRRPTPSSRCSPNRTRASSRRCICCRARSPRPRADSASLPRAAAVTGSTLTKLQPFAESLAPAQEAARSLFKQSTPIIKNQIRPLGAGNPAGHQPAQSIAQGTQRSLPRAGKELLGVQRTLQRVCLQPRAQPGRLPVLPRLGHPRPQQRAQHGRRSRAGRAHASPT